jgi:hypothetical protein
MSEINGFTICSNYTTKSILAHKVPNLPSKKCLSCHCYLSWPVLLDVGNYHEVNTSCNRPRLNLWLQQIF